MLGRLPCARRLPSMQLAHALLSDPNTPNCHLILADIVEPTAPAGSQSVTIKADLTAKSAIDALFDTEVGIPGTIYALHGIMSRGSEDNFDLGLKVRPRAAFPLLHLTVQYWRTGQL